MTGTHAKATFLDMRVWCGGRPYRRLGGRSPAAAPAARPPEGLGPGRGLDGRNGLCPRRFAADAGDPVRPGPEETR
jgi:hypothetical protein